jgi:hypothetical protein
MAGRLKPTKRYNEAWRQLYAQQPENFSLTSPVAPKKKRKNEEDVEQIKYNLWFDRTYWPKGLRWFHPPNGGRRNPIEGAKFRRMGVKAGTPDIVMPISRKGRHGLVIELKRVDGVPSDLSSEQKSWLDWFAAHNWQTHVAFGFEQAKKFTEEYLDGE